MISAYDYQIEQLVNDIENGNLLLPEMQRGFVWKSTQVRDLFDSLYRGYPSGQLLVWQTNDLPAASALSLTGVPAASQTGRTPDLLLDGQQRMTSLTAIIKGRPLFVRWKSRPIDIVFNVKTEHFEIAIPRYRNDPAWVSLTRLFTQGVMTIMKEQFAEYGWGDKDGQMIVERLQRIDQIRIYTYRVNRLTDVEYDEVTDIFVRINSGGTRLSSADLTLAQLSSRWTGITNEFEDYQKHIKNIFDLDVETGTLVRALASLFSGQSRPAYMFRSDRREASIEHIKPAWERVKAALEQALTFLRHNCLIDRLWMLPTQSILITLTQFFDRFQQLNSPDARLLQRWVYLALLWSRYSSSAESMVDQDVAAMGKAQPVLEMTQLIYDRAGERPISERQLRDQRSNSAFMLMSYVLARVNHAQDWFKGTVIGSGQDLHFHHIFPKALLKQSYSLRNDSRIVDQVANLAFISAGLNRKLSDRAPADYLPEIEDSRLQAQYIPLDQALWVNFEQFVEARRTLLADAINKYLEYLAGQPVLHALSDIELVEKRIKALEHQLREIVANRLTEARGAAAWEECVPPDMRESLLRRVNQRLKNHPYEHHLYTNLTGWINMALFSDYSKLIQMKANWPLFQDLFGSPASFDKHISAVLAVRNAMAHNNQLTKVDLMNGEAGLTWIEDCVGAYEQGLRLTA